jgi:lipopolysaccharide exporter
MTSTSGEVWIEPSGPDLPQAESPPLSARVRRGALWSLASSLLMRLLSIAVTAVVAHILDPRDFGIFAVALTAYAIVSSIGQLGVSACLMRADLDIDHFAPTVVTISWTSSAVLAGAMVVYAKPIASVLGSADGAGPIRAMSIAVVLAGVFAVPCTQLMREFRLNKQFVANVVSFVPTNVILFFIAGSGGGAMAFAWSRVIGQLIEGIVVVSCVQRNYWPGFARDTLPVLLKFGLPLAGANFVNYILLNVDYAFVGHLLGAIDLGIYVLAFNVASWPSSLLGTMIANVSIPAFSRVKHDSDLLKDALNRALRAVALVVAPICGLTVELARPLIFSLYGARWAGAASVVSVLSFYGAISILCILFTNIIASLGRTRLLLAIQLIWIAILIPAMAAGVHRAGIVGAAFAHIVVISSVVLPAYLFVLKRTTSIRILVLIKAVFPGLIATCVAVLAARLAASCFSYPLVQLITGLAVGGLVYVLCVTPYGVAVLNREPGVRLRRVIRAYENTARLMGFLLGSGPRHSAKRPARRARQSPRHRKGVRGPTPVADEAIASSGTGASQKSSFRALTSLSNSVPTGSGNDKCEWDNGNEISAHPGATGPSTLAV